MGNKRRYLTLLSIHHRCTGGQQSQQAQVHWYSTSHSTLFDTAVKGANRDNKQLLHWLLLLLYRRPSVGNGLALLSFPLHRCTGGPLPKITGIFSSLKGEEPRYPGLAKILNSRYSIHRCTGGQACIRAFFFFRILNNLSTAVQEAECGGGGGCFSAAQT